jgi:hypothetical protein
LARWLEFLTSGTFGFLLKVLTTLSAVGFGILGVGVETRNKDNGRLSRNGKIALIGIVAAGVLAMLTGASEFYADQNK